MLMVFTVTENVMLGREENTLGFLVRRRARRDVAAISEGYGLEVPQDALLADLPVGVQQRVDILKALTRDAKLLVLPEPWGCRLQRANAPMMTVGRSMRHGCIVWVVFGHSPKV